MCFLHGGGVERKEVNISWQCCNEEESNKEKSYKEESNEEKSYKEEKEISSLHPLTLIS
jgi:hypothetical protein